MTKPLRLVHCTMEIGFGGGIARVDSLFHRYLNRDVIDPVFVVAKPEEPDIDHYDPTLPYVYIGSDNRFEKLLEIMSEADIVQFSGGFDPLVCEAAKASQVPVLIEIMHHSEPGQMFPYIDVSACVSETVRAIQPVPEKTIVIHNGLDIEQFPFERDLDPLGKFILLESTRREKKSHIHLDELADNILPIDPSIELWLAGRGQEGESTDRVKFLGMRTDIDALYRKADMMVLLSRKEPFGLVALEAMASGCVPIASDDGGMAEIITNGVNGWLVAGSNKEAVTKVVMEAFSLRGSEKWERMQQAARETVEKKFTARGCVEKYESLYLHLIEKKGRREKPGPIDIAPTPDALVGDATYHYPQGWDMVKSDLQKMLETDAPITARICAKAVEMIALQAISQNRGNIADMAFRKLYLSGYKDIKWMKQWIAVMPEGSNEKEAVVADLLSMDGSDAEVIMMAVEQAIGKGSVLEAVKILENGLLKNPDSVELKEIHDLLKSKLDERQKGWDRLSD
ncbi:hypothetical protein MNBD_NITROSPINAE04-1194 [hydrothermal vent metagenome]|uniref:Glycosyl transferase family 1 domain-containing protein n=1 Tax=hydrothermal vent metagenome TaxID=652676 RepID=A0A3B1BUL2_9ZZZZ